MVAITVANCTLRTRKEGEWETILLQTPSTADSANTIDITSLLQGRTVVNIQAWDTTTGDTVTATLSTATITIDAAGGTTDHVYVVRVDLLHI